MNKRRDRLTDRQKDRCKSIDRQFERHVKKYTENRKDRLMNNYRYIYSDIELYLYIHAENCKEGEQL